MLSRGAPVVPGPPDFGPGLLRAVPPPRGVELRSAMFRLELLGGFRITGDGPRGSRPLSARQQQLLAYLALHDGGPVRRQEIAGRLWPDSTDGQALTNLRREWYHLREEWPAIDALVDAGPRTLTLRAAVEEKLDVRRFARAADRGLRGDRVALDEAARIYRGDVLPDCGDAWIHPMRERLRQTALRVLGQLLVLHERELAFDAVIERARHLLQLDPLNEPGWCALMHAHARRGERAIALHLYQECTSVLKQELGVQPSAATRLVYRDILEGDAATSTPAVVPPRTLVYPLVGRQAEWATLQRAWQAASEGQPQFLLIRGEAGIGKTRLAEELTESLRRRGVRVLTTRCYAGDGRLAYAPIAAWLQSDALQPALAALDPVWLTEIARLHPGLLITRPDVPAPEPRLESSHRARFFEALSRAFRAAAPFLLVLDDLQWSDADTLDWLPFLWRSAPDLPCLVVATVRAEEEHDNRALPALLAELARLEHLTTVTLGPLDAAATARLAEEVAERTLDADTQARTFRLTEGHPLFIVEQGRMALGDESNETARSPRVQSVVEARLARLSEAARDIAQIAAAIGREFTFDLVAEVSGLDEDAVVRALDELWRRYIVRVQSRDAWDFTHDRLREVAYATMGPARTRLMHRRIAEALERRFASDLDRVSAAIASHLDRAGQSLRAIPFFQRAGHVAMRLSANEEAIRCLTFALSLTEQLTAGRTRDERELALRAMLSAALTSARGYAAAEVEDNVTRVVALASALHRGNVPVRWLWGLWTVHFVLGDLKSARAVAERAHDRSQIDPSCQWEVHHAMGVTLMSCGELHASRRHFESAGTSSDERGPRRSAFGSDLGVFVRAGYAHTLWLLGEPEAAREMADASVALAQRLEQPYSEMMAQAYASLTHQLRGDIGKVAASAQAAVAIAERYGFAYYRDWADLLLGWSLGREGHVREGLAVMQRGLDRLDAQRALGRRPYFLSLLAETHVLAGDRDTAIAVLDSAIAMARARDDRWWLPELSRQRALLAPAADVAPLLRDALSLAQAQGSGSLMQRIVASIAAC
jgi:DNA-binding SARP family transcriptional activator/tetratricopeptide (TPR) repeat protein